MNAQSLASLSYHREEMGDWGVWYCTAWVAGGHAVLRVAGIGAESQENGNSQFMTSIVQLQANGSMGGASSVSRSRVRFGEGGWKMKSGM